jgi:hypothetical protein
MWGIKRVSNPAETNIKGGEWSLTINVPDVYMGRYEVVLREEYP